jgi:Spy/CpxP family protein refolding chaperone
MSAPIKPWLLLGGIFLVGIVTGSALTFGLSGHFMHPPRGDGDMRGHWMAFLNQRLNLTPDQKAKIKPIIMDASMRIRDQVQESSKIFRTADEQILAILTPEQKIELKQLEDEREKMFLRRMRAWMPPGGGPPGAPFPDRPDALPGGPPGPPDSAGPGPRMTPPSFNQTPTNVPPPPPEKP